MHWSETLIRSIHHAKVLESPCRISVYKKTQAILGRKALEKIAPDHTDRISFHIVPEHDRPVHFIGMITILNQP